MFLPVFQWPPQFCLPILTLLPILTFWATSGVLHCAGFDSKASMVHPLNSVTFWQSIQRKLALDIMHVASTSVFEFRVISNVPHETWKFRWWMVPLGMLLLDTIEYFAHRAVHTPFLYRHAHKTHHEIKFYWSSGAVYQSFLDATMVSGAIIFAFMFVFEFSFLEFSIVSSLGMAATCVDHCEYFEHLPFGRRDFHKIHHSVHIDCNYQQPFFTFWDRWLGTDYASVVRRKKNEQLVALQMGAS